MKKTHKARTDTLVLIALITFHQNMMGLFQ